jgi:hypothetical protein
VLVSGVGGVTITEVAEGMRGITSTLNITSTAPSVSGAYRCLADNGVSGRGDLNMSSAVLTVYGEWFNAGTECGSTTWCVSLCSDS